MSERTFDVEISTRTKWCPFARVARTNYAANRRVDGDASSFAQCIGSECMAWRQRKHGPHALRDTGYCGLAGKP